MGRAPCCDKSSVKKGPWSPEEDAKLKEYIEKNGTGGNWIALPQKAGLRRCGKSCRLRWLNYLRPNIKHGEFSDDEDRIICTLFASIGSRWSIIAAQLPGRTDNDIKNYWNTKLKKKLFGMVNHPHQSQRRTHHLNHSTTTTVHHATTFSSLLQSSSSPSSTLLYNCSNNTYHTASARPSSFSCFQGSYSNSSTNSCITAAASVLQHNYHLQEGTLQMLGAEASCSSSDGSYSNQQISQSKENIEYEYGGSISNNGHDHQQQQIGMRQSYNNSSNNIYKYNEGDESQKLMASNGLWGESETVVGLDYGLEEIKQLISTSSCNSFVFDENKADQEKVMYY